MNSLCVCFRCWAVLEIVPQTSLPERRTAEEMTTQSDSSSLSAPHSSVSPLLYSNISLEEWVFTLYAFSPLVTGLLLYPGSYCLDIFSDNKVTYDCRSAFSGHFFVFHLFLRRQQMNQGLSHKRLAWFVVTCLHSHFLVILVFLWQ